MSVPMTFEEFMLKLKEVARSQSRPVAAIDFEIAPDGGTILKFYFKDEPEEG